MFVYLIVFSRGGPRAFGALGKLNSKELAETQDAFLAVFRVISQQKTSKHICCG